MPNMSDMPDSQSSSQANTPTQNGLSALSEYIKQETSKREGRAIPPLEKWNPQNCGDMDLVIKANGEWWHEGSKIQRQSLVDLFATVLWKEGDDKHPKYYLKTPVEKIKITVEDVPFLITDVNVVSSSGDADGVSDDGVIEFTTSTGDVIELDDEHPLQMRQYNNEDRPYIPVRFGMLGLISRQVLMHLTKIGEMTEQDGCTVLTLHSKGKSYQLSVVN